MDYELIYEITDDLILPIVFSIPLIILFLFIIFMWFNTLFFLIRKKNQIENENFLTSENERLIGASKKTMESLKKVKNNLLKLCFVFVAILLFSGIVFNFAIIRPISYLNNTYVNSYDNGKFKTVEGKVSDLSVLKYYDKDLEETVYHGYKFKVDGVTIYCDTDNSHGYNEELNDEFNQIRKNGQQVKIGYMYNKKLKNNIIVKLEILKKDYTEK